MKFVCKSCNYRFEVSDPIDCPYCGNEQSFEEEKDASGLLEEVERLLNG